MKKFITLFLIVLGVYVVVSFINDNGNPEIKAINKVITERDLFTNWRINCASDDIFGLENILERPK